MGRFDLLFSKTDKTDKLDHVRILIKNQTDPHFIAITKKFLYKLMLAEPPTICLFGTKLK